MVDDEAPPVEGVELEPLTPEIEGIDGEVLIPEIAEVEEEDSSSSIVRYDPLRAYLREISAYPQLSREEEHELAIKYQSDKNLQAAYKLVTSNLWLVVKIARDYEKAARTILDLIQEGNIGLMEAVKNFDPYRGVRFPSYAVWWVKAYIVRYLIANWRMVKIGTTQAQRKLFFNLQKEKEKLEREGFYPEPKLLAERLQVKESEIVEMEQRLGGSDMSVDAPLSIEGEGSLLSVLPSGQETAEEMFGNKEIKELFFKTLDSFKETLNKNEKMILDERLLAEDKATLEVLADKLALSRERVRQIEEKVKKKLRVFLEKEMAGEIENLKTSD